MKPAFSVLIFTVSSGAGYGLLVWMILFQILSSPPIDLRELIIGASTGLLLVTLGLLSSTLHLANPKNAWRAFNRFRTSWLSREGVFSLLFYPVALAYGFCLWLNMGEMTIVIRLLGLLTILTALVTTVCTGMIYASLKPIRQWHNPLTTPLYILFSLMSGVLLLMLLRLAVSGSFSNILLLCFMTTLLVTLIAKMAYFFSIGKPDGATINTATGFSQAEVRLLDAGHNADTFLTKEFGFDPSAMKLLRLRRIMCLLTFVLPALIVSVAFYLSLNLVTYLAAVSIFAGLLLERWLFFAEARHVVRLYHGDQRT